MTTYAWIVVTYDKGINAVQYIGPFNEKDASAYAAKVQGEKTSKGAKAEKLEPVPV